MQTIIKKVDKCVPLCCAVNIEWATATNVLNFNTIMK